MLRSSLQRKVRLLVFKRRKLSHSTVVRQIRMVAVCELPRQIRISGRCMPGMLSGPACRPIGSVLGMHSTATE